MDIYANDTMIYGCISKIVDDQSLTADLSSDLALTAQWEKNWLVTFNASKKQTSDIPSLPSEPKILTDQDERVLRETPCLEYLLGQIQPRHQVEFIYMIHC